MSKQNIHREGLSLETDAATEGLKLFRLVRQYIETHEVGPNEVVLDTEQFESWVRQRRQGGKIVKNNKPSIVILKPN